MKHYLMTTETDFQKATGCAAQNPAHSSDDSGTKCSTVTVRNGSEEVARNDISRCVTTAYTKNVKGLRSLTKIISGEDRIRTCGPVSRSSV